MVRLVVYQGNRHHQHEKQFQFHYGTIGSFYDSGNSNLSSGFNSTMVRLVGPAFQKLRYRTVVSIPLWYDW